MNLEVGGGDEGLIVVEGDVVVVVAVVEGEGFEYYLISVKYSRPLMMAEYQSPRST